jgi:hypothetical protein
LSWRLRSFRYRAWRRGVHRCLHPVGPTVVDSPDDESTSSNSIPFGDRLCIFFISTRCRHRPLGPATALFDLPQVDPGAVVRARSVGQGALAVAAEASLPAFLAPSDGADPLGADDPRLIPLGSLHVDEDGNGALTFRVPPLDEGRYDAWILCEACAASSGGRRILPVGSLVVVDPARTSGDS